MNPHSNESKSLRLSQLALTAAALLPPFILSGCGALADSSASVASVASISASSAAAVASIEKAFQDDVRMMAATSAESGAGSRELLREIGRVAADHGITDWESDTETFYAVGEGLRQAGVSENDAIAMAPELTTDQHAAASLLRGYRAAA